MKGVELQPILPSSGTLFFGAPCVRPGKSRESSESDTYKILPLKATGAVDREFVYVDFGDDFRRFITRKFETLRTFIEIKKLG